MSTCNRCDGWGCRQCRPSTYSEADAPGVESHDVVRLQNRIASLELQLQQSQEQLEGATRALDNAAECFRQAETQLEAAWAQLGEAWRREGASLAEAIRAKCHVLEGLGG